jgi:hypothetical protein
VRVTSTLDPRFEVRRSAREMGRSSLLHESPSRIQEQKHIFAEGHNRYRFWTKQVYTPPQVDSEEGPIDYQILHERVECGGELKNEAFGFTDYRGDSVMKSISWPPKNNWQDILPDTRGESFYLAVCALARRVARKQPGR